MTTTSYRAGLALAALLAVTTNVLAAPPVITDSPMPSLAPMVKKVSPTVVSIATSGTIKDRRNPLLDDPFFRQFLPPDLPRERKFQSLGSGVVVDATNGYIITNAHVIENANEITVTAQDDHQYKAEVVGADEGSDVAVLKLKQGKLPAAITLGDSSKLEVGDFVVAIGNPFGLQHTVTSGIVSGLGRVNPDPDSYQDFIQTDASINPGNSGGALVNLRGELVGINSAILSRTGGSIGIGFAIPVNMVKNVMDQLIKYGEVKRGLLGVNISNSTLTPDVAQAVGAPADTQGALVLQVVSGSPADKAGIKVNDIITSVNAEPVKGGPELKRIIGMLRIGDKVDVGVVRDGKPRKVTAIIAEGSASRTLSAADIHEGLDGAKLEDADDNGGVVVLGIEPGSPASQVGLRTNDVIVGVNRARVANLKQLKEASAGSETIVLNIRRDNVPLSIVVR